MTFTNLPEMTVFARSGVACAVRSLVL